MNVLKKSAIAVAVAAALGFSGSVFAVPTAITNGTVSATVNDSGTFSALSYLGDEYLAWGTVLSYYRLNSSLGSFTANNAASTNPLSAVITGSSATFTLSTASPTGLYFSELVELVGNKAVVSVRLTNPSLTTAISGVQWGVGLDPDQAQPGIGYLGGTNPPFDTFNSILGQGGSAAVIAVDPEMPYNFVNLRNTTDAGAFAVKAYIDGVCCSPVDPNSILTSAAQAPGFYGLADRSINLAFDIGTIAPDTSVAFSYEYVFGTPGPIPEPETYAMLLAGLGLMGWIARRRKQNAA